MTTTQLMPKHKVMMRKLATVFVTAVCTELEVELMIPSVAEAAETAFNYVKPNVADAEVGKYFNTTLEYLKEEKSLNTLGMKVLNYNTEIAPHLPETDSTYSEIKVKDAVMAYYRAACKECGIELLQVSNSR